MSRGTKPTTRRSPTQGGRELRARVSAEEYARVQAAADGYGMTVPAYVRGMVLGARHRDLLPAVMAATEPEVLERPLPMAESVLRTDLDHLIATLNTPHREVRATLDLDEYVVPVEPTEAPCLTCRHYAADFTGRHRCTYVFDVAVWRYRCNSGAQTSHDGLPTNRTMRCPGWAAKETT